MLSIEYVIAWERAEPSLVYRSGTTAHSLGAAEQVAHATLDVVGRMFSTSPVDAFQILDDNDDVVLRSWETIPARFPVFAALADDLSFASAG
jgi:hypothetical protein